MQSNCETALKPMVVDYLGWSVAVYAKSLFQETS